MHSSPTMPAPIGLSYLAELIEVGIVEAKEPRVIETLRTLPDVPLASLVGPGHEVARAELVGALPERSAEVAEMLDLLLGLPDVVALAGLGNLCEIEKDRQDGSVSSESDDGSKDGKDGKEEDEDEEEEEDEDEEEEDEDDEDEDDDEDDDEEDEDDGKWDPHSYFTIQSQLMQLDTSIARLSSTISTGFVMVGMLGAVSTVGILVAVAGMWCGKV